jgi:hypothetical protein
MGVRKDQREYTMNKGYLIWFSTHASITHQQPINICYISTHIASTVTSSCMLKNFKIVYLTHMIFILNSVFTVVFYPTRWAKIDHTCIYFEEFLNQLNLLYKYRMSIYAYLMTQKKPPVKLKISSRNFLQIWMSYACKIDKNNLYDL